MDAVQKQALKDLLHLLVDKEEVAVLQDLCSKLPAQYQVIASGLIGAVGPIAVASEDGLIDSTLA